MSDIIDKNLNKLDDLETKFDNIQNRLQEIKSVFDMDEPLELEEVNLDDIEIEITSEECCPEENKFNDYFMKTEVDEEDFGIKLNIKNKHKSQFIIALLESGYKVSLKGRYILIEEGETKFG